MTEKQVREAAKIKAQQSFLGDKNEDFYVKEYKKVYGEFVPEARYKRILTINRSLDKISAAQSRYPSLSGSQLVSLRKEIVVTVADLAENQGAEYEEQISQKLSESKQNIEDKITNLKSSVYNTQAYLSDSEVAILLSNVTLEHFWNSEIESTTLTEAASYKGNLSVFASGIRKAAQNIEEVDRQGSIQFSEN